MVEQARSSGTARAPAGVPLGSAAMVGSPLVVGVDMSSESQLALTAALRLARRLGCGVLVVHAVGLLEEGGYRPRPALEELLAAARSASPDDVSEVPVELLREDGPAADVLVRVAERAGAELLVVGRRGSGEAGTPLGSVSEAVLAHSAKPVLVVPIAH